jgi:hypothetical protein
VSYILRLGLNEMVELMTAWELPHNDLQALFTRLQLLKDLTVLREVVFHALKRDKPQITVEVAGDVITQLGFNRAGELIVQAIGWAMPEEGEEAVPAEAGDAPKGAGTFAES